jgi:uncharacterized protein (DUF433 family)
LQACFEEAGDNAAFIAQVLGTIARARSMTQLAKNILEWLSAGMTVEEILTDYEGLEREDIMAALAFASQLIKVKRIAKLAT